MSEQDARSRQEQILTLAGEGLTDKEIAVRLKLSPETVGTYWRRILAKYAAASRTEVVAKVVRLQAQAEVGHLTQVSEGLREVADHLLAVLGRSDSPAMADSTGDAQLILRGIPDLVVALDAEGFTTYANRSGEPPIPLGEPFEWCLAPSTRDVFRESLSHVLAQGHAEQITLRIVGEVQTLEYVARLGAREPSGAVVCLRPVDISFA